MFFGDCCIYLCGGDTAVAQKFLDGSDISPPVKHMGGKAVPEDMGVYLFSGT